MGGDRSVEVFDPLAFTFEGRLDLTERVRDLGGPLGDGELVTQEREPHRRSKLLRSV